MQYSMAVAVCQGVFGRGLCARSHTGAASIKHAGVMTNLPRPAGRDGARAFYGQQSPPPFPPARHTASANAAACKYICLSSEQPATRGHGSGGTAAGKESHLIFSGFTNTSVVRTDSRPVAVPRQHLPSFSAYLQNQVNRSTMRVSGHSFSRVFRWIFSER